MPDSPLHARALARTSHTPLWHSATLSSHAATLPGDRSAAVPAALPSCHATAARTRSRWTAPVTGGQSPSWSWPIPHGTAAGRRGTASPGPDGGAGRSPQPSASHGLVRHSAADSDV